MVILRRALVYNYSAPKTGTKDKYIGATIRFERYLLFGPVFINKETKGLQVQNGHMVRLRNATIFLRAQRQFFERGTFYFNFNS